VRHATSGRRDGVWSAEGCRARIVRFDGVTCISQRRPRPWSCVVFGGDGDGAGRAHTVQLYDSAPRGESVKRSNSREDGLHRREWWGPQEPRHAPDCAQTRDRFKRRTCRRVPCGAPRVCSSEGVRALRGVVLLRQTSVQLLARASPGSRGERRLPRTRGRRWLDHAARACHGTGGRAVTSL